MSKVTLKKVTFKFNNDDEVVIEASQKETLLEVAKKANVPIEASCLGNGSCGKCRVKLISGNLLGERTRHITKEEFQEGYRLACACKISEDVEILVPDISRADQK